MMKRTPIKILKTPKIIIVLLFCYGLINTNVYSQTEPKILKATNNKNVTLIFTSPIKQAIVGSSNFNFAFDTSKESNIGILKGVPGLESDLLIITKDGNIYSFIIRYEKTISELTHFINVKDAIGNLDQRENNVIENNVIPTKENIIVDESTVVNEITINDYDDIIEKYSGDEEYLKMKTSKLYDTDKALFLKKYSSYISSKEPFFKRYFTLTYNVYLYLNNIIFSNNEVFFILRLENNGILDYDVNYINLYITSLNKNKRSSSQKIKYEPIYTYNMPKRIGSFKSSLFVLAFSKFSINNKKAAILEVNEKNGERNLKLEISHKNINNPNSINN